MERIEQRAEIAEILDRPERVFRYQDRLHGTITIDEPVLCDLIETHPFQRLAGVGQLGHREAFREVLGVEPHNRFEHSLGVWHLLKKHGAPLDEQVGGLLHDLSHGTFSHSIDFLQNTTEHSESHEELLPLLSEASEVSEVLASYGLTIDEVIDDEKHPLKERSLPDLCADRIDYILRDGLAAGLITKAECSRILGQIFVTPDNHWVLGSRYDGEQFADLLHTLNHCFYISPESFSIHRATTDCLSDALAKEYITETDLYVCSDDELLRKIDEAASSDQALKQLREKMNRPTETEWSSVTSITHKSRVVDPWCLHDGKIARLSEIDREWRHMVEEETPAKVASF